MSWKLRLKLLVGRAFNWDALGVKAAVYFIVVPVVILIAGYAYLLVTSEPYKSDCDEACLDQIVERALGTRTIDQIIDEALRDHLTPTPDGSSR